MPKNMDARPQKSFEPSSTGDSRVNHPPHYNSHPSGVECIQVVEHMSFNIGNAIKYLWRADHTTDPITNLKKAAWYINREIERRTNVREE